MDIGLSFSSVMLVSFSGRPYSPFIRFYVLGVVDANANGVMF